MVYLRGSVTIAQARVQTPETIPSAAVCTVHPRVADRQEPKEYQGGWTTPGRRQVREALGSAFRLNGASPHPLEPLVGLFCPFLFSPEKANPKQDSEHP